jgi:WD40 repeat protein
MTVYCFNPNCSAPQNPNEETVCQSCSTQLQLRERYRAVQLLGQGGFGRTFLAIAHPSNFPISESDLDEQTNVETPQLYVIKQFLPDSTNLRHFSQAKTLFQHEAYRLKELGNHPQIPTFIENFEQDHLLYLVQEYVIGETLASELAKIGKFRSIEIWQLLENLLPLLHFIHSHTVIHRDIKPENIIRQTSGSLALVDFGAAKLITEFSATQPGTTIGSPDYSAPEQVRGKATFASDLYSLGVTCIHLLTGIHPFHLFDFSSNQWVWQNYLQTDGAPAQDAVRTENIDRLIPFLNRLIEPALSQRFPSAEVAIAELQKLRGTKLPSFISPPSPTWEYYATLTGHDGLFAGINAIAFSPDGKILASASDDKTIRLWNVETGSEMGVIRGHAQFVKAIAFHPTDSNLLASSSSDRIIKLWRVQDHQEICSLLGHTQSVNALTFSPDGKILASASSDKAVRLWDTQTHQLLSTLSGHTLAINAVALSSGLPNQPSDRPLLATGSSDSTVKLWDLTTFELLCTLTGHTAAVKAIAFSPDAKLLATGSEDRTIRLWDVASHHCLNTFPGHPWPVAALAFLPDGKTLLSGSWDKTVKLCQISTGKEVETLSGHIDSVSCVAIAPTGSIIASGSKDKTIRVYSKRAPT